MSTGPGLLCHHGQRILRFAASYRGLVQVQEGAEHSKSTVRCDALLIDTVSRSDTYPPQFLVP
jgi:SUF system FeS cluster assembly, SufBD